MKLMRFFGELALPQLMFRVILFLVASLVRKSFKIEIVEMLSDLKEASPFLCYVCSFVPLISTLKNLENLTCTPPIAKCPKKWR